jgi:hypothetical protein
MRKIWILLAAVAAFAVVASGTGAAYARADASGPRSVSCSSLLKKFQTANGASTSLNPKDPNSFKQVITSAAKQLRSLASNGPKELRPSFTRLAAAYDKLANVSVSDPSFSQQLSGFSTTFQKDLEKITGYFAKCHVSNSNTSGSSDTPVASGGTSATKAGTDPACALVTKDEVSTAVGYSVVKSAGVNGNGTDICTFQGAEDSNVFYVTIYNTPQAQQLPLSLEAGSEPVTSLGDSAFFAAPAGLWVRTGGRVLGLQDPGGSAGQDALAALAAQALPNM